jgi:uncharacterized protein (DUF3820 family)
MAYVDPILHFGKYKGHLISDIPSNYLSYLLTADWVEEKYPDLLEPINTELAFRTNWNKHFYDY